jgi:hypothetical protein
LLIPPNISAVVRLEATYNKLHMSRNGFWKTGCLKVDLTQPKILYFIIF